MDNTILESYFKNSNNVPVKGVTFPLRVDNRQYCSPTDYQGKNPSCCGYSAAQILESINWMKTGIIKQFDANQIYAKAKETDGQLGRSGTYPDLAMVKGLELAPQFNGKYEVKTSTSHNIDELKRVIHKNMFACINMSVTKDFCNLNDSNFVYKSLDEKIGGHSLVCCGYDDPSKMFIMQNHWGTIWGLKGFFLCPYDVWKNQCDIFCWYEAIEPTISAPAKKEVKPAKKSTSEPKPTQNAQVDSTNSSA